MISNLTSPTKIKYVANNQILWFPHVGLFLCYLVFEEFNVFIY